VTLKVLGSKLLKVRVLQFGRCGREANKESKVVPLWVGDGGGACQNAGTAGLRLGKLEAWRKSNQKK